MKRVLLIAFAACSGGTMPPPDSGHQDSGPHPPGPQQFCVRSSCEAGGVWRVIYMGTSGNPVCKPVDDQIEFTSDGGSVCMLRASDGGSDGGCGLQFVIRWQQDAGLDGSDTWNVGIPDAGHMYGTWHTEVTGISNCQSTYDVHAVR